MAKKLSQATPATTLDGFTFAGLQGGQNSKAPSELVADLVEELVGDIFQNGIGTTFDGDSYNLGGDFSDVSVDLTLLDSADPSKEAYLRWEDINTTIELGSRGELGFIDEHAHIHLEPSYARLIWDFGEGTTIDTLEAGQNGIIISHVDEFVNHTLSINGTNAEFTLEDSIYSFGNAAVSFSATDTVDSGELSITTLESSFGVSSGSVTTYVGAQDDVILFSYEDGADTSIISIAEDITIYSFGDIKLPGFENRVLSVDGDGILVGDIIFDGGNFLFSAGSGIDIDNSSWSAFFGENHTITGIFNDGIVAGEDHLSEGIAGNNAIFGRDNKLTGTGTKNFNMMAGDNNEISASGISSSLGNFIVGIGNVIDDSSNSAIIGTGINLSGVDETLAVNNLLISTLTNAFLGTDADGIIIDATGALPKKTVSTTTYTVLDSDKGYALIFTNAAGCDVTFPDTLGDGFNCMTIRADGAGIVEHFESGTTVIHTDNGSTTLEEENTASSWIFTSATDIYGFGSFGSGTAASGIQDVLNADNTLVDTVSSILGPHGINMQFGVSTNGINGLDFAADEMLLLSPNFGATNDSQLVGFFFDGDANQLNIISDGAYIYMDAGVIRFNGSEFIFGDGNSGLAKGILPSGLGAVFGFSGAWSKDTTPIGNVGTGEDTLKTVLLPGGTLDVNGRNIFITSAGTLGNTINNKRIRLKFGATTIFDTGALAITVSADWTLTSEIIRTGAATQKCITKLTTNSSVLTSTCKYSTAAETLSGDVNIVLTGEATANNDVVVEMINLRFEP